MTNFDNIPLELLLLKQWVCWRYEKRYGQEKPTKVPYDPNTGRPAKSNDPSTWACSDLAVGAVKEYGFDGVGIMFANGIFGIDIDGCIENGEIADYAAEIIRTVKSYTEISPSGTGIHILCKGSLPDGRRRKGPIEMYQSGRFFTVTGELFGENYPFGDCTERVKAMHAKYLGEAENDSSTKSTPYSRPAAPISLSDEEIIKKACTASGGEKFKALYDGDYKKLCIGDGSQSAADQAFCNLLAFWFGCDAARMDAVFRRSGLMRPKWDQRRGKGLYGELTIERAIKDCRETYNPQKKEKAPKKQNPKSAVPSSPMPPQNSGAKNISKELKMNSDAAQPLKFTWDDTGNARRLCSFANGNIRFNVADGKWLVWDGCRWATDEMVEIKRIADRLLDEMKELAAKDNEFENITAFRKHIQKTRSSRSKEAMIRECRHQNGIPLVSADLDRPANVFNTKNGMVNLRNGNSAPHDPALLLSKVAGTSYDSSAPCPRWEKFLDDVTENDAALKKYLQCMAGYCLTASTREQCVFFLFGNGSNGKSTFVDTLALLMGDYAANCQPETVMLKDRSSNARTDIARLRGIRMVTTAEPNDGCRLDEGTVKQMTGGTNNKLTARFLYGEEFEFTPEFKIVMSTNYKPVIKGTDNGIWRRVRLIPFTAKISEEKKDKNLPDKLKKEFPGILNWAIQGAIEWYRNGMPKCAAVEGASAEYRAEMDTIQQFCDDCVAVCDGKTVQSSRLYLCYKNWCSDRGDRYPIGANKFYGEMKKRFVMRKTANYNEYIGIEFTERGIRFAVDTR